MAPHHDARLRKILWTVYWRGNAQLRERIEDELRPQDKPKVKPKKELPDPVGVLDEVMTFVELARDGACMAGDRRGTTPNGRSGGIRSAGWQPMRWRRWRPATPHQHSRPSRRLSTWPAI